MYKNGEYLVEILRCFLSGEEYIAPNDIDTEKVVKIAGEHSVTAMVGVVIEKSGIEISKVIKDKIAINKIQCGIMGAKREVLFDEISRGLTEAKIENIIVKGYVLRELYPVKDLRTMSDLDFVIKSADGKKMEEVMEALGYELESVFQGDWSYFKNKIHIEIHEKLTESELGNGFCYDEYLKDCFSHTIEFKGLTKTLDLEYHLIYMLIHCAKHFYNGGCGFRMILDFGAYIKKYNEEIDWEYVNTELKKIRLYEFAQNIWYLCERWFKVKAENKDYSMDMGLYEEVYSYILHGGTYGQADGENRFINAMAREAMEKGDSKEALGFWEKIKSRIFLDDESMRGLVLWYRDKPKILLPIAWLYKGFAAFKKRGLKGTKEIISLKSNEEEVMKEYKMLKGLGLYRKK